MEIGAQIKKFRTDSGLSQDELAERIYVSRQTVSNWETAKSYPDVNSLVLMSETFGVTVDALLKDDVQVMREAIEKGDSKSFLALNRTLNVLFVLMILTPIPLARFLRFGGLVIWLCIAAVTLYVAIVAERKKKELNIQTYKEIVSFLEGKRLNKTESAVEAGKRPYQKVLLTIVIALLTIAVEAAMFFILK